MKTTSRAKLHTTQNLHLRFNRTHLLQSAPRSAVWPQQRVVQAAAGASDSAAGSRNVLEAFYYGKALATVLNKRLGELAVSLLSEATRITAEAPQRLMEIQDEVQDLVAQELGVAQGGGGGGGLPSSGGGGSSGSGGGGSLPTGTSGDGVRGYNTAPTDIQAVVDDLRADIAASRAVLQQLRDQEGPTVAALTKQP